jgi:hypothetical protein
MAWLGFFLTKFFFFFFPKTRESVFGITFILAKSGRGRFSPVQPLLGHEGKTLRREDEDRTRTEMHPHYRAADYHGTAQPSDID